MPHANAALVESDVLGTATPGAWLFVTIDSTQSQGPRTVILATAGQAAQGILSDITTNAPVGQGADVATAGTTQLTAGSAWTAGQQLTSDSQGRGIPLSQYASGAVFSITLTSGAVTAASITTAGQNFPNPGGTVTFNVTGSTGTTTDGVLTVSVSSTGSLTGTPTITTAGSGITGTAVTTFSGTAANVNAVAESNATAAGAVHHVRIVS